ncbi:MAG: c-type cytochrome [Deltaproteobacteria bacterium]|nr:c-type cytochrome [Deltaproteobacteria bacterium]
MFAVVLGFLGAACAKNADEARPDAPPRATASADDATSVSSGERPEPAGDAARGKALVGSFECRRCHEGTGLEPEPLARNCRGCHLHVLADGFSSKPASATWKSHVAHLGPVPSLVGAGRRLRYEWLVRFLVEPHDLRPALTQSMPRLALSREQARDVATYLASLAGPSPTDARALVGADAARGRKLMDEMECGACHRMSGVEPLRAGTPLGPEAPRFYERHAEELRPAVMLAPDLRHVRERMTSTQLVEWLRDPPGIKGDTLMPRPGLTPEATRDVAAYLLTAPLAPAEPRRIPEALPNLTRRVAYEEVAREVLDVTCRHCHGSPDVAVGDGGPGNSGGFGFKRRAINFTSYEHAQGGYVDDAGERHSLFEPLADGTPRIVAALWARHREVAGSPDPSVRGMPLGLPPLAPEKIQLVATWIAQGRPR